MCLIYYLLLLGSGAPCRKNRNGFYRHDVAKRQGPMGQCDIIVNLALVDVPITRESILSLSTRLPRYIVQLLVLHWQHFLQRHIPLGLGALSHAVVRFCRPQRHRAITFKGWMVGTAVLSKSRRLCDQDLIHFVETWFIFELEATLCCWKKMKSTEVQTLGAL